MLEPQVVLRCAVCRRRFGEFDEAVPVRVKRGRFVRRSYLVHLCAAHAWACRDHPCVEFIKPGKERGLHVNMLV